MRTQQRERVQQELDRKLKEPAAFLLHVTMRGREEMRDLAYVETQDDRLIVEQYGGPPQRFHIDWFDIVELHVETLP